MRDRKVSLKDDKVNLPLTRGTHCIAFIIEHYSGSYGCPPPKLLTNYGIRKMKLCFLRV